MSKFDALVYQLTSEEVNPLTGRDDDAMRINRRRRANGEFEQVQVRDLRPGMIVVDEIGYERVVKEYPRATRKSPYLYVTTDGEPINTQGGNLVDVKEPHPVLGHKPRPTMVGSGRINPAWSKAWNRGEDV